MVDRDKQTPTSAAPPAAPAAGTTNTGAGARTASSEDMKAKAKAQMNEAAEQAKAKGQQVFQEQKTNAVGHLDKIAQALHQTATNMRNENEQTAGKIIDQAASGLERLASGLRTQDMESMYYQARNAVRRQPALFIGGTIAAGFLISRFLKSSEEHPHTDEQAHAYHSDELQPSSYVTSAHANPDEITAGRAGVPPKMPSGRRNY